MRKLDARKIVPKPRTVYHIHLELTEDEVIRLIQAQASGMYGASTVKALVGLVTDEASRAPSYH